MTLNIKKAAAYSAAAGVFVKKSGVYSAVQGMFVKVSGVYQSVLNYLSANTVFDYNYLSGLFPNNNAATGSMSFWYTSNSTITAYRTLVDFGGGKCSVMITDTGLLRVILQNGGATSTLTFITQSVLPKGHVAIEWDTTAGAGSKVCHVFVNGTSVPLTVTDANAGFVPQYQFNFYVGAANGLTNPSYADLGEFMFWPGTFANWATNISKVYSASGPVDPGANGIKPLGVVPYIYLSVRGSALASTIATNLGSGIALSAVGKTLQRADEGLIGYGDSLLFGTGSTINSSTAWMPILSHALNRPIKMLNYGVGGTSTAQIAGIMASGGFSQPAASVPTGLTKARKWMIEGGYNDVAGIVSNGLGVAFTPFATAMVNTMLALDPSAQWIYLGIPTGNVSGFSDYSSAGNGRYAAIMSANAWLAAQYGSHFLDINAWILANWQSLNYTSAGGPASITPTGTDLTDVAAGVVPSQLRMADNSVHWNDLGHYAVSVAVLQKLTALGYN